MATFTRFEDIEAWQRARVLTRLVNSVTRQGVFAKDLGLCRQLQRASVSIMSNKAEGFERNGNREFIHFLSLAKGSAGEVRSQLYVALDEKYIDQQTFNQLSALVQETSRLITGLMNYLRNSKREGFKFKPMGTYETTDQNTV